jgi:hypothetical protein
MQLLWILVEKGKDMDMVDPEMTAPMGEMETMDIGDGHGWSVGCTDVATGKLEELLQEMKLWGRTRVLYFLRKGIRR